MRVFIFGVGYSAGRIGEAMLARGWAVAGTTRSSEKAEALRARGIKAMVFDGEAPSAAVAAALRPGDGLVVSIAPAEGDDPVLRHHADTLRRNPPAWIGYLSTIGVYGDAGGGWVDETTPVRPLSRRSRARVAAEEAWTALGRELGAPVSILRLSGIYGPGRNAFVNLADGTARRLLKPGQVFNRIHVDDIATATLAALDGGFDGPVNVTDDEPAPPQDVVAFAAALMGVAPPPLQDFASAELSPMARSFYGENKRVSNRRLREALGVALAYPTYRDAFRRMWAEGSWR